MCGETRIPRDMCAGKHTTRGNTYHYDTGRPTEERSMQSMRCRLKITKISKNNNIVQIRLRSHTEVISSKLKASLSSLAWPDRLFLLGIYRLQYKHP